MPNRLTYHKLAAETGLTARFQTIFLKLFQTIGNLFRSVQIWFQNTRNRKKRLANYLNNCSETKTSTAVDNSNQFSQTAVITTKSINEYGNFNQTTTTTTRDVMKPKKCNKTITTGTKAKAILNNDTKIPTNTSSLSELPLPDLPTVTNTTTSSTTRTKTTDETRDTWNENLLNEQCWKFDKCSPET